MKKETSSSSRLTPEGKKKSSGQLYLEYTLLFLLMAALLFAWYIITERTFISTDGDNYAQHYASLLYYGEYLRDIWTNLISGNGLVLPSYDFSLGLGGDILTTLNMYCIGDPLTLLSVFFNEDTMWICYEMITLLRMYLAGLVFIGFMLEVYGGKKSWTGILTCAITYAFCAWALTATTEKHYYFINPLIFLPLILTGVERVIKGKRPWLLVIAVYFAAISNMYFFYMIVIMTVIYVVFRLLLTKTEKKASFFFGNIIKIGLGSVLGVVMACAILLPVLSAYTESTRLETDTFKAFLMYSYEFYDSLLENAVTNTYAGDYWLCIATSALALPAMVMLFRTRKRNTLNKIMLVLCCVSSLVPIISYAFNLFAYVTSRWSFVFALVVCASAVAVWEDFITAKRRDLGIILAVTAVYGVLAAVSYGSDSPEVFVQLAFSVAIIIALLYFSQSDEEVRSYKKKQTAVAFIALASICVGAWYNTSVLSGDKAGTSLTVEELQSRKVNTALAAQAVAEDMGYSGYYRYATTDHSNDGFINGVSSTNSYWSNSNSALATLSEKLGLYGVSYVYENFDMRASLLSLASVKYYVSSSQSAPYGFSLYGSAIVNYGAVNEYIDELTSVLGELDEDEIKQIENDELTSYYVYTNDYALPLGYTYSTAVSETDTQELNAVQLQELMLQSLIVSDDTLADSVSSDAVYSSSELEYTIECGDGATLTEDGIVTTSANATVTLTFDGLPNSETYILIEGLDVDKTTKYQRYTEDYADPGGESSEVEWDLTSAADKLDTIWSDFIQSDKDTTVSQWTVRMTFDTSDGQSSSYRYFSTYAAWYTGMNYIYKNVGYSEEGLTSVTITFASAGVYSFDSISIVCQSMDNYAEQIAALSEDVLENIEIGTDCVSGTISLDEEKWLCIAIPYSEGWTVYVDDVETEYTCANLQYIGFKVSAGEHEIYLEYNTPLLRTGVIVSAFGILVFVMAIIGWEMYHKKRRAALLPADGEQLPEEAENDGEASISGEAITESVNFTNEPGTEAEKESAQKMEARNEEIAGAKGPLPTDTEG